MNAQLVGGKVQRKLNLHFAQFSLFWLNAFDKLVSRVCTLTTTSGTICLKSQNYVYVKYTTSVLREIPR
jgi:hypothetical protein